MLVIDGAGRERQIVETLVELSETTGDTVALLRRLVVRSVQLLGCVEAGSQLNDGSGALSVIASSGEHPEALGAMQMQDGGGPSLECVRRGSTVVSQNLADDAERWPAFARAALARGFRSVQAVPMRVDGRPIGALILFRSNAGPIPERDAALSQAMADIVAVALARERAVCRADGTIEQLQRALTSRVVIEQAKGVLAARTGLDVETAFNHLRTHARDQNRRLVDIARILVDGGRAAEALIDSAVSDIAGRPAVERDVRHQHMIAQVSR